MLEEVSPWVIRQKNAISPPTYAQTSFILPPVDKISSYRIMAFAEIVKYWAKSAKLDLEAAESLLKSRKYTHCLFFGHKKCTAAFTKRHFCHIQEIYRWVLKNKGL